MSTRSKTKKEVAKNEAIIEEEMQQRFADYELGKLKTYTFEDIVANARKSLAGVQPASTQP